MRALSGRRTSQSFALLGRSCGTLGDMNKPVALTTYFALWAIAVGGIIYWMLSSGYSLLVAVACAYLLFVFVNGSIAYRAHVWRLRSEGKKPLPYFRYLLFPLGISKLREEAPRSTHLLVGVVTLVTGVFFVYCGIALAFDAEWSRIPSPLLVVTLCLVPGSIGVTLLYAAWRLFAFRGRSQSNVT